MLGKDYQQIMWCPAVEDDFRSVLRLAIREDVESIGDLTTLALIPEEAEGSAALVARTSGVIAGVPLISIIIEEVNSAIRWEPALEDGMCVNPGSVVGRLSGPAHGMLQVERLALNFLGRLSGVASMTRTYVEAVRGLNVGVYDTRKTTPGWRLLEKYAVQCGGGRNHRSGLYEAVLIKDNHLALAAGRAGVDHFEYDPAEAVRTVRKYLAQQDAQGPRPLTARPGCEPSTCKTRAAMVAAVAEATGSTFISSMVAKTPCHMVTRSRESGSVVPREPAANYPACDVIVEVEVDTLGQFESALGADPDIILLDNMTVEMLSQAVKIRNARKPQVELEASGGITLKTIRKVAETGVERISVGALTHSPNYFDIGMDWG